MNLRETILSAQDTQKQLVTVPEWLDETGSPVEVEVRGMDGNDRSAFIAECVDETGKPRFDRIYAQVIIACSYDPATGAQLFEPTDRDVLNSKSAAATERLAKVALELSGLGEDAAEDAKNG